MKVLERRAVLVGAIVAAAIALPAALIGDAVLDDEASSNLVFLFLVPVLIGFGIGGAVAARRAPASPLANGAVAALAAFAVIQGIGLVRRLVDGDEVSLPSIAFAALLAYSSGLLGAATSSYRRSRG